MYSRKSFREYRHTLSRRESNALTSLSYTGKTLFTPDDLEKLVGDPRNLLDSLVRKRWILKIRKGVYAIVPFEAGELGAASYTLHSLVIASVLVKPYYVGYWSALNYHGLTDQTPPAVYVATSKARNTRTLLGTIFRFVTIPERKMFGSERHVIERWNVAVSSPEKTIADCLDHPEHCGGVEEVAKAMYFHSKELNPKKLAASARKIGNSAVIKRMGYVAEALGIDALSGALSKSELGKGYSLLDPTLPKCGAIRERWRLVLNAAVDPFRWTK